MSTEQQKKPYDAKHSGPFMVQYVQGKRQKPGRAAAHVIAVSVASPQDSARPFENAHISSGDSDSEEKSGTCSVDII